MSIRSIETAYVHELLRMVVRLGGATAACFYLVDKANNPHGHILHNLDYDGLPDYVRLYEALDPFHPRRLADCPHNIVTLDDLPPAAALNSEAYFREFMHGQRIEHEAEMLFRGDGRLIAGISLLRTGDRGPFHKAELSELAKVHGFLEYSLVHLYLPHVHADQAQLESDFGFSERQIAIVRMLRNGASNHEIVRRLSIRLPTVKTHLQKIYAKARVSSRTELVARIYLSNAPQARDHSLG
ncbi:helix-turn-helix transcriptional regulator [Caulobacter sp. NIBR2454]|uniref:helix-turn-helix transcriptional regulator n=1 Tax=Caulobacter sp. NIBR2454 TaxID=3015996 RepID=UPI0022B6D0ED|nr:LuxR C-terminal-related transcriptional regulator [Caulobacter sp. NIBR2454]